MMSFDVPVACTLPTAERPLRLAGLLPTARRHGDRLGYPPAEASTARMLADAEDLGLEADTLTELGAAWRDGDCTTTHQRLTDEVTARLDRVQADLDQR